MRYVPIPEVPIRGKHQELFDMLAESKGRAVEIPYDEDGKGYKAASAMTMRFQRLGMRVHRHLNRDRGTVSIWLSPMLGASEKLR
jgi:hypothetical protein